MTVEMTSLTIVMLLFLQLKHFLADYLLQPGWVIRGKGNLRRLGGYAHAGMHAMGSVPAYLAAGLQPVEIALLAIAEFVFHYLTDYTKAGLSRRSRSGPDTRAYWALHGADQLVHQLTYAGLILAALALKEAI
jgi:hypothetical protein